jgi:hypothetical protein
MKLTRRNLKKAISPAKRYLRLQRSLAEFGAKSIGDRRQGAPSGHFPDRPGRIAAVDRIWRGPTRRRPYDFAVNLEPPTRVRFRKGTPAFRSPSR